jgi:predicted dehydrogenase
MSRRRYRVAIVGCGKIAGGYDAPRSRSRGKIRTHIKAYLADPIFEVVAACDSDARALGHFCSEWGIPGAYRNLQTMLVRERPDVVSVCVPTRAHKRVLETVARHRPKLVFAEKPFTGSVRDARSVLKKLKARKIAVAVNYLRRWCPNHRRLKAIIDSGRLGRLRSLDAAYSGNLLNIGSHLIDLILYLAGEIQVVRGEEVILKGGARGYVQRVKQDRFSLQLLFDRGLVRIARYGYQGECVAWRGKRVQRLFRFSHPSRGIDSAMKHAVGNLADHLSRRIPLASTGDDAVRTLKICGSLRP